MFLVGAMLFSGGLFLVDAPKADAAYVCVCEDGSSMPISDEEVLSASDYNNVCSYGCQLQQVSEGSPDQQLPTGDNSGGNDNKGDGSPSNPSGGVSLPNFIGESSISGLILKITDFLITLALPFAAFMIIWAGFQFATAQGDPAKLTKAKQNFVWTIAGVAVILASKAIISYITGILGGKSNQGSALIKTIETTLKQIIGLLFLLVTVYFFWGVVDFVRASSSGDTAKLEAGKKHMIWGIVGMAIMLGAWGLVGMLQQFFK